MYQVTLLTSESMSGVLFANALLRLGVKLDRIYLISGVRGGLLSGAGRAAGLLARKSALFLLYKYFVEGLFFKYWIRPSSGLMDFGELGRRFGIPVERVADVKDPFFKKGLVSPGRDRRLFLSAYGSQVFDSETVRSCPEFWNVHGSWLPFFRGAAPYFWMLLRDTAPRGITLHRVAEELDSGEILLRAEVLPDEQDSLFTYHARCVAHAARTTAAGLAAESPPRSLPPVPSERPSFGGLPRPADVRELRSRGRSLFRLRDISAFRALVTGLQALPTGRK